MSNKTRFRSATGCSEAWFTEPPAFTKGKKPRGSKRAGHTFERKVGEVLYKKFGDKVLSNVWIGYNDVIFGERICSPDHLIVDVEGGWITIVECKLSHTRNAWRQINDVYWPVMRVLFPGFKVRGIEVCKNFEMSVDYPVRPRIVCGWNEYFEGGDNVMVCGL